MTTLANYIPASKVLLATAPVEGTIFSFAADGTTTSASYYNAAGLALDGPMPVAVSGADVLRFTKAGSLQVTLHQPTTGGSEVAWESDGQIVLASPGSSSVVRIDQSGESSLVLRVPGVSASDDFRSYVSGVAIVGGTVRYATVHGISDVPGGWLSQAAASQGAILDLTTGSVLRQDLRYPGSPRWHNGLLWFLNGGHGQLCTWDLANANVTVVGTVDGFARGLTFTPDGRYALVGISQGWTPDASQLSVDPNAQPGIAVLDLQNSGTVVDFQAVDAEQIFDVQWGTGAIT